MAMENVAFGDRYRNFLGNLSFGLNLFTMRGGVFFIKGVECLVLVLL